MLFFILMMDLIKLLFFLTVFLLINQELNAQIRTCTTDLMHQQLLEQSPQYRIDQQKKIAKLEIKEAIAKSRNNCSQPFILPVAIHFQQIKDVASNCLINAAEGQIAQLNLDFQGENRESTWWEYDKGLFPNVSKGVACLQFEIANQGHPSGYNLQNGALAITINQTDSTFLSDWAGYINIFVRPFDNLGNAPYGGNGNGDGITIDISAFGINTNCGDVEALAPFNRGRTLTHEMGHYLFLKHIWGQEGCAYDDGVLDTPVSLKSYSGCPGLGLKTCESIDLHVNFMDYVDDYCMYMFTTGQVNRMERYVTTNLLHILEKANDVIDDQLSNHLNRISDKNLHLVTAPNPFVSNITVRGYYPDHLDDDGVTIQLYDRMGRRLYASRERISHNYQYFEIQLNLDNIQKNMSSGIYFLQCEFANVRKTIKINKTNL